ncbi:hypothetical protein [Microbulbifer sp.]|uniref:hypothetical protein n=1 Tax=Microbulbifer sp. TaxID=1908541 RepID=UPI00258AC964|nr:hypothetical protein [Microbulbifer sp.]
MSIKPLSRFAALFLVLLLAACSGGGSSSGGSDTPQPEPQPQPEPEPEPEPPTAPTLSWEPRQTKTFHFSWQAADNVDEYTLLENVDGKSGYEPIATIEGEASEHDLIVFLPEVINASYILEACNEDGCAESDPVTVNGNLAEAVGYFKASNAEAGDAFGVRLALSADGLTLVVGVPYKNGGTTGIDDVEADNNHVNQGAVYVFRLVEGAWQQAYVEPAVEHPAYLKFGMSVSLSADGNTLAVGATGESSGSKGVDGEQTGEGINYSGAVYIVQFQEGSWRHKSFLKASNPGRNYQFGNSVSLSADGERLAVGAWQESSAATGVNGNQDNTEAPGAGAVYIFGKEDDRWKQETYIKASNTDALDRFGEVVALSADGQTLAVGAQDEESLASGVNADQSDNSADKHGVLDGAGAVYVFTRMSDGWQQQAYLKPSSIDEQDRFGRSLAISTDGNVLAVGSDSEDGINGDPTSNDSENSGAVYIFERNNDEWMQAAYLKPRVNISFNGFGRSVSLSADGSQLAVGMPGDKSISKGINEDPSLTDIALSRYSGAVYLFNREGGSWVESSYLKAQNADFVDRFGTAVVLSSDGRTLVAGAPEEDGGDTGFNGDHSDNSLEESGAIYVY